MKIRIEYTEQDELDEVLSNLKDLYNITYISKVYFNRPPSIVKRVYVNFEFKTK